MKKSKPEKITCNNCQESKPERNFYNGKSGINKGNKIPMCKDCINKIVENDKNELYKILRQMDIYYDYNTWQGIIDSGKRSPFGSYIRASNMHQLNGKPWDESSITGTKQELKIPPRLAGEKTALSDDKNKADVIRMIGYDPFVTEAEADKKQLYDKLVDFLDESTLEDSFKLPAVIEIVKAFNQIDKINTAISRITSAPDQLSRNVSGIKSLIDAKEKMLKSVLALAKDNGISVNHNNNKSKGSGTLTGIIKQLQEKRFKEAEINLFDIETSEGMRQVADISNRSILAQLQFDENDYSQMILEQRKLIEELKSEVQRLEEENRHLKIKISKGDMDEE